MAHADKIMMRLSFEFLTNDRSKHDKLIPVKYIKPISLNLMFPNNLAPFEFSTSLQFVFLLFPEQNLSEYLEFIPNSCCTISTLITIPVSDNKKWRD